MQETYIHNVSYGNNYFLLNSDNLTGIPALFSISLGLVTQLFFPEKTVKKSVLLREQNEAKLVGTFSIWTSYQVYKCKSTCTSANSILPGKPWWRELTVAKCGYFLAPLHSAISSQELRNDPTLSWKKKKWKLSSCFPSTHLTVPEPGPYLKVPDDIQSALETCSSAQDGLSKGTVPLEGPLEDE